MKPGTYPNIPMAEYLKWPAFSATLAQILIEQCPAAAHFASWLNPHPAESENNDVVNAGTIGHSILLEGSMANIEVIDPMDYPAKSTGSIPDGWTNKSIQMARDAAIARGKTPVLKPKLAVIESMVSGARSFLADPELLTNEPAFCAAFDPDGGDSELSVCWDDHGTLCRIRPDRISKDRQLIVDLKFVTTSAEPDRYGRSQMVTYDARTRAAFYRRGARATWGTQPEYVYWIVEQSAPHLPALIGVDPEGYAFGAERAEYALREWRHCVEINRWHGYPRRVCYPVMPPWEQARWLERQGIDTDAQGIPYDPAVLFNKAIQ